MKRIRDKKLEITFNEYCRQRDIQDKSLIPFTEEIKLKRTYPEFELRRARAIKKKFDSLSYKERIHYVEEHFFGGEFFSSLQIINDKPGIHNESKPEILDKKCISLFPLDDQEAEVYISWKVQRKIEQLQSNFMFVISRKKHPSEKEKFILNELKRILNEQERDSRPGGKYFDEIFQDFQAGYKHRLLESHPSNWRELYFTNGTNWWHEIPFIDGIVNYSYEHFLKSELENLQKENSNDIVNKILLHWNGNKNQLYDVIIQLKQQGQIKNSFTDLAVFLKFNFDNFSKTSLSTIETELQRGKRPAKGKRINLSYRNQE